MESPPTPASRPRRMSLDVLRIIAIVGVVAIHTFSFVVTNPDQTGTAQRAVAIVLDLGFIWAVPVFVMISGALILRPATFARGIPAFYRSRAVRLVPALVFWNLVYLLVVRWVILGTAPSRTSLVEMFVDGRFYTQLYFLWIILGLYVVAPVLAAFLQAGSARRAYITAAVALAWVLAVFTLPVTVEALFGVERPIAVSFLLLWLPYVGYFLAGYALSLDDLPAWARWTALGVALATGALTIWQYATRGSAPLLDAVSPVGYYFPVVALLSLSVFVFMVGWFDRVHFGRRTSRVIVMLSNASFGVFLVHLVIVAVLIRLIPGWTDGSSLARTAVVFALVLVVSYAISIGASRIPYLRAVF
ncbi:acyltransferase [Agromyces sp. SYSU K20354]|uniref:acyltransferase n=1 Tax=Agromyces cavernae TaxID=2898659 RepID=UPI001E568C8D|nr:acyltransferase family protein [Agromyces cavernae]MCD2444077.1 acyltransferase [Agromyces cavernae]